MTQHSALKSVREKKETQRGGRRKRKSRVIPGDRDVVDRRTQNSGMSSGERIETARETYGVIIRKGFRSLMRA